MVVSKYPIAVTKHHSTLILGTFESLHFGHVSLFEEARKWKLPLCVMLIENASALPKHSQVVYQSFAVRLQQLANLGIDYALVVDFTPQVQVTPGRVFMQELIRLTNAQHIVVGTDFALGFNRDFTAQQMSAELTNVHVVPVQKFQAAKLSTRLLRELVEVGDMHIIAKLSPFNYSVQAQVSHDGSFVIDSTPPQRGVYAAWVTVNEVKYWAMVKCGFAQNLLQVPQLNVDGPYPALIEFCKLVRVITREAHEAWVAEDEAAAHQYLQNLLSQSAP